MKVKVKETHGSRAALLRRSSVCLLCLYLMAEFVCPPITVEGDWSPAQTRTVTNKLQIYFGSKKKSGGGGDCRVDADSGAARAAVFFSSAEGEEPSPTGPPG